MIQNDLIGLLVVYLYVAVLLLFTEKLLSKKYPISSRKILHIMTGNIAFILPLFQTREIMAFLAAGPFIIFTFLMSPYSPLPSMRGKTSRAGHGLGLVYYAISWTVLAYFFFDHKEIIAIGILAMSYGDGFASLIGSQFGKKSFRIFSDVKSLIGSSSMYFSTFVLMIIALLFYEVPIPLWTIFFLLCVAAVATFVEAITPLGLDNLTVPFVTSIVYWMGMVM